METVHDLKEITEFELTGYVKSIRDWANAILNETSVEHGVVSTDYIREKLKTIAIRCTELDHDMTIFKERKRKIYAGKSK